MKFRLFFHFRPLSYDQLPVATGFQQQKSANSCGWNNQGMGLNVGESIYFNRRIAQDSMLTVQHQLSFLLKATASYLQPPDYSGKNQRILVALLTEACISAC